jgi:hypothetical protein
MACHLPGTHCHSHPAARPVPSLRQSVRQQSYLKAKFARTRRGCGRCDAICREVAGDSSRGLVRCSTLANLSGSTCEKNSRCSASTLLRRSRYGPTTVSVPCDCSPETTNPLELDKALGGARGEIGSRSLGAGQGQDRAVGMQAYRDAAIDCQMKFLIPIGILYQ